MFLIMFIYHFYIYKENYEKYFLENLKNKYELCVNNMSYANNMSYVWRLDELYELCRSYDYFYVSLKITCFLL